MAVLVDSAIVRIYGRHGQVVGGGFLVTDRHVLTCAHVIATALGLTDNADPQWDAEVKLDFPLLIRGAPLSARIVIWEPPKVDGEGDIAGLELTGDPPPEASPVRLLVAEDLWRHEFRTFGFPPGYQEGVWASGRLLGRQAIRWVQMEEVTQTGYRVEPGFSGTPVWDDELSGVVGITVAADITPGVRSAYLIPSNVIIETWPILATQAIPPCPYRGLLAFREQDSAQFFGRELLSDELIHAVTHNPLVALIGSSGIGKSSLVFAGLVPRLRQRSAWVIADVRFSRTPRPVEALAAALLPMLEPQMSEAQRLHELPILTATLSDGRLADVVDRIVAKANGDRLLLVIDQFEELFALDEEDRRQCIDMLLEALARFSTQTAQVFGVLVTLRADFLELALSHAAFAAALQTASLMVGPMTQEQLRQAIEGPAARQVTYEPGLVERILGDVGEEPGSLPLLEFALTLLWDSQNNYELTHTAYDGLGGVEGALTRYAEDAYLRLPESEQEEARHIFLQLVRPGEGTEPTRRMARRTDLNEERWTVAQRLATTRLVVIHRSETGPETLELVHEALISSWARMHDWVKADYAFRGWQERLRGAVRQWEASGRDGGALFRGAPLAEAERWLRQRPDDIGQAEQDFVKSSRALQGRTVRRLQASAAALSILLVIAVISATIAIQRDRLAGRQSRLAISRYLTGEATSRMNSQPDLSILLTLTAFATERTSEARRSLLEQIYRRRDAHALLNGHNDAVTSVAFSPDGRTLASGSADETVILWDATRRVRLAMLSGDQNRVNIVAFSPDGRTLAAGSDGGKVTLWDVARHVRLATLNLGQHGVKAVAFSPDGRTLAAGSDDGKATLWDVARHVRLATLHSGQNRMNSVTFSPDGGTLAVGTSSGGGGGGIALLFDVRRRHRVATLGHFSSSNEVSGLAFSPDGRILATSTDSPDDSLVLWSASGWKRIGSLTGGNSGTLQGNTVAFRALLTDPWVS